MLAPARSAVWSTLRLRRAAQQTLLLTSSNWPCKSALRYVSRGICDSASSPAREIPVAFAFDIDGVLKAGEKVLPGALRALDILDGRNSRNKKLPYILMTNGGGVSEADRAKRLSLELGRQIRPSQVIQAHTVMRSLTNLYRDKPIFMVGGPEEPPGAARQVKEGYGFERVYTCHDVLAWRESSWPFSRLSPEQMGAVKKANFASISFAAVLVFHDSRDWGRDIQFICDILRSPTARFGTLGDDSHPQIPLYFSHGDLLWGNDFGVSRFGQGAFRKALEGVYQSVAGRKLEATTFGKPERLTYEYADALLRDQVAQVSGVHPRDAPSVWMIGDNPSSDIAGANAYGWKSALVRTGVYRDVDGPPVHPPTVLADDVEAAVTAALAHEWGCESAQ